MERLVMIFGVVFIGAVASLKTTPSEDKVVFTEAEKTIKAEKVRVRNTKELASLFENRGFNVKEVRRNKSPVPRIHLASLPKDMKTTPFQHKKERFVQIMLPMILEVNRTVLAERAKLKQLKKTLDRGVELAMEDAQWVTEMAKRYRVKSGSIDELLIKVDIIPPSLALAQASLESGWLMSAAARQKNSTFGHMATKEDVEKFKDLFSNVEAYILNLNRHAAYKDLRKMRASMRKRGKQICSTTLAKGLQCYSERGMAYIRDIQKMIKQNDFKAFDASILKT